MRVVLDWDGTATTVDTLWISLERFGDRDIFHRVEGRLVRGEISYRDLMELELSTMRATLEEVNAWLRDRVQMRAGFHELAMRYNPLVLSSGFEELIRPLLARERVELELVANRVEPRPDGWRVLWRDSTPCPVCGDLCKRRSLPAGPVVYIGDGYSDRCAALAAERVFARAGLAEYLAERRVPFEPFDDLHEVAAALER